jgi:predicted DNA-binding transcriptional regulator AlpA
MKNQSIISEVLTRKQVAEQLHLCQVTADRLDIPRIQVGRRVLFRKQDIERWLENHTQNRKEAL